MRNLVAKNDFNRAAVHTDRSKEPQDSGDEGLLEYLAQTSENAAQEEYQRTVHQPKGVKLYICGAPVGSFADGATIVVNKPDHR
ncbi:hypothetical protein KASHIRA_01010 [Serratia phage vB_SmaM-Kashira]|nr:hypothetical protein KASHIRA_01010 [Serratia phage vB_SmaM-Kashira]